MENFDAVISLFPDAKTNAPIDNISAKEVLDRIQCETYATEIQRLRIMPEDEYKMQKVFLPAVTWSGLFPKKRNKSGLAIWSNIFAFDIDHIGDTNILEIKALLQNDPHTLFCFTSPSGKGIKGGLSVHGIKNDDDFKVAYFSVERYFRERYNIIIDKSRKNIDSLCFVSFDPDLYRNSNALPFNVNEWKTQAKSATGFAFQTTKNTPEILVTQSKIRKWKESAIRNCVNIIQQAVDGERHNARRKAGFLAGGYIGGGMLTEHDILPLLLSASDRIAAGGKTTESERKTIINGIEAGRLHPISEELKIAEYETWLKQHGFSIKKSTTATAINDEKIILEPEDLPQYIDTATGEIIEENCFWYEREVSGGKDKEPRYTLHIDDLKLLRFLEFHGFTTFYADEEQKQYIFIRVVNNIAVEVEIKAMINFVRSFIEALPDNITEHHTKDDLLAIFARPNFSNFSKSQLEKLKTPEYRFHTDKQEEIYLYFQNCYLTISPDNYSKNDYQTLGDNIIWRSCIIKRDFHDNINDNPGDFEVFVKNINDHNEQRITSFKTLLGYLLHRQKRKSTAKAVVLADENISEHPQGRTGKGLSIQAVAQYRNVEIEDGRTFNFRSQFRYQNISLNTDIFLLDDVAKRFDFEKLFSVVTEDFQIEKKNKQRFRIPFEKSPKLAITTNYTIEATGDSAKGRIAEFVLKKHYDATYSPVTEFGREFFSTDWNKEEWASFDNFMINSAMLYLKYGALMQTVDSFILEQKRLIQQTSDEFVEWASDFFAEPLSYLRSLPKDNLLEQFLTTSDTYRKQFDRGNFKSNTFSRWIDLYCQMHGIIVEQKKERVDGKPKNVLIFRKKEN